MSLTSVRKDPIGIYYIYASKDTTLQQELSKHLRNLNRSKLIIFCNDKDMSVETEWECEQSTLQIILLLISPDFMSSNYIDSMEMKQALKRDKEGTTRIIPILLRPVNWEIGQLAPLAPLPSNGKFINTWRNKDQAFVEVEQGIRKTAVDLWLNYGKTSYQKRNFTLAIYAYRQFVTHFDSLGGENLITAYTQLGHIYYLSHEYEQALDDYEHAIKLGTREAAVYANTGHILYDVGKRDQALQAYDQAIHLGSQDSSVHANTGLILYEMGKHDQALQAYDQAIHLGSQDSSVHANTGHIFYNVHKDVEALEAYTQATKLGSREASVYANKGRILYDARKHDQALQDYKQASILGSQDPSVYANLNSIGQSLSFANKHTQALDAYEYALPGSHGASNYANRGHILYIKNEYAQALTLYEQAIHLGSQELLVYARKGHIFYNFHKYIQALQVYEQAIHLGSQDPSVYGNKGHILYAFDQLDSALEAYEWASTLGSQDPSVYGNKGHILYDAQKHDQALQDYNQASTLGSQDPSVYGNMGHILYDSNQLDPALEAYEQASKFGSRDVYVYAHKGKISYKHRKYEYALKDLEFSIHLDSTNASLYDLKGEIHYALEQYKDSFESYRKFMLLYYSGNRLSFYKEMSGSYWNIISNDIKKIYLSQMKIHEIPNILFKFRVIIDTLISFLHLISFSHNTANAYNVRGRAFFNRKHYKEALVAFEIAIQMEPEDADFWHNKGDALRYLERIEESEQAYEQAKKLDTT